ncbi:hypothetical protein [Paenibacillus sp. W4I10]|uniref:hypothetical protein n=1 Tax=Paenibacillus sp. W4I10 TaxID=3042298 RepID=UPI0027D77417|nr:hypothetical protein [Paenibacillus sp. W4I10]
MPPEVKSFPLADRRQIIDTITKALDIKPERPQGGRSMWDSSDDPLIATLEDGFYTELDDMGHHMLASLLVLLGLPVEDLQKGPGDKRRISDLVKEMRSKGTTKTLKYGSDATLDLIRKVDQNIRDNYAGIDKIAEKYILQAGLVGRVLDQDLLQVASVLQRLPTSLKAAEKEPYPLPDKEIPPLTSQELQGIEQSVVHAASKVSQITDNHRAGAKELIVQSQKERWGANKLSQALFDAYGDQNRDWRRVAITELAMATNDAYLAALDPGDEIQVATVPGACPHCQKLLEGKTFVASAGSMPDGFKYIWPGKSNIGRKASEWWPCCPLHPHCRHRWVRTRRVNQTEPN